VARCAGDNFYGGAKISRRVAHLREADCVAGHVRLELKNVVANYPFERSHRFPGARSNFSHGDDSPLSCGVAETSSRLVPQRWQDLPRFCLCGRVRREAADAGGSVNFGGLPKDYGGIAGVTFEIAAAEMALCFHMSDHRLDGGAPREAAHLRETDLGAQ
jgi:hypothetical protein